MTLKNVRLSLAVVFVGFAAVTAVAFYYALQPMATDMSQSFSDTTSGSYANKPLLIGVN